jgi:murein L,D-transpeptidase YafK
VGSNKIGLSTSPGASFIAILLTLAFSWLSDPSYENSSLRPSVMRGSNTPLQLPMKNPRIVVYKNRRQIELYDAAELVRTYRIGLGFSPIGDKEREGDGRTPEGEFYVFVKNPRSAYHLSLGISYPNIEDAERGLRSHLISKAQFNKIVEAIQRKKAPPQYTPLGGLIYIHGNGSQSDWTWGCVALDNEGMRELFDAVAVGTPVKILP